jgi:hypothetical protein
MLGLGRIGPLEGARALKAKMLGEKRFLRSNMVDSKRMHGRE